MRSANPSLPSVHFVGHGDSDSATSRYRCINLVDAITAAGGSAVFSYRYSADFKGVEEDVVVLHRVLWDTDLEPFIADLRRAGKVVAYGLDDLLFDPEWPIKETAEYFPNQEEDRQLIWNHIFSLHQGVLKAMMLCDCVIGSTELIAEGARKLGKNAFCIRNFLGNEQTRLSEEARRDHPLRNEKVLAGYLSGSKTHNADVASISKPLGDVLHANPNLTLLMVGIVEVPAELQGFGPQIRRIPMVDWKVLPSVIATLDFLVSPLDLTFDFNHAKSHIKWLEAAAVGVPAVVSRTSEFELSIKDEETGFMAATDSEWVEKIRKLADDKSLRIRMGAAAQKEAVASYIATSMSSEVVAVFQEIADRHLKATKDTGRVTFEITRVAAEPLKKPRAVLGPFRFIGKAWRAVGGAFRGEI
ncbi:MAG TPA: glycosyltransferase [Fimbriimonadaceae bacterium]|jgi:glycosyltransferase involved in cell wall biosynthesis